MTSQLSLSTYYGLLKLLSTAAASSAGVATTLLGAGVLATTRTLLATSPLLMAGPGGAGASSLLRTPDQLYDVMGLLHEVLPPVPDSQSLVAAGAAVELPGQGAAAGGSRSGSAASRGSELQSYLGAHPPLTAQLCGDILPLVLNSYSATVMPEVRPGRGCRGAAVKPRWLGMGHCQKGASVPGRGQWCARWLLVHRSRCAAVRTAVRRCGRGRCVCCCRC